MTDVFLIHHDVHQEGQQGEEEVVGELNPKEDLQVEPDLEIVIPRAHLSEQPGRHPERHAQGKHEAEAQELAQEEDPFRHR